MPENPVKTGAAATLLGCGVTRVAAIKRALGITSRWVLVSKLRKFIVEHPEFKESDVYHPAGCNCQKCRDWVQRTGRKRKDFSNRKPPRRQSAAVAAVS